MNIKKWLLSDKEIKIALPRWLIILFIFTPLFAYGDTILYNNHYTLSYYFYLSFMEILLMFLGYNIGYNKNG
jgi:hypothetical protein